MSIEPLLGPINANAALVENHYYCDVSDDPYDPTPAHRCGPIADWVVVGGESGPGARPIHPDWVRDLRDQCVAAGLPFFFKQWGEWDGGNVSRNECQDPCGSCVMAKRQWDGKRWHGFEVTGVDWKLGNQTGALQIHRIGKKAAGRLLDGREWNEYPDTEKARAAA